MIKTVITKTPLRLSLGGGGTDLPAYVKEHGGFIFGASLNRHITVTVRQSPVFEGITVSDWHGNTKENISSPDEITNTLIREAVKLTGFSKGLEITSFANVVSGTGLGSSGAFTVGLLHALYVLKGERPSAEFLADRASHIFLDRLQSSEGKQDPYLAACGGYTAFALDRDNRVTMLPLTISDFTKKEFEARTLYFYTGVQRLSTGILDEHQKKAAAGEEAVLTYRHRVKEIGQKIKQAFETGNLDRFGELLHAHWQAKKESSSGISIGTIDALYEKAREAGMLGGKILGAGGGGFFMAFVKPDAKDAVRAICVDAGLREIPFRISEEGTTLKSDYII